VSLLVASLFLSIWLLVIGLACPRVLTRGIGAVFGFVAILVLPFLVALMGTAEHVARAGDHAPAAHVEEVSK
jgi:hypothetical protein